jgi:transcriptional regulator with XRE-family HTH domain
VFSIGGALSDSERDQKQVAAKEAAEAMPLDRFVRKRVGQKVQESRLRLGFSQEELCARAGLNRTYLSDIERGEGNATLTVLTKISGALQTSLSDLFTGVETAQKTPARILVADTPQGQARLRRLLEGHDFECVQHFKDARNLMEEGTFDLIIGGLHFNDGRIFDLMRAAKLHENTRHIPFVCFRELFADQMTHFFRQAVAISCAALGAASFLESDKYGRSTEGDLKLRKELEQWLPSNKRLWTS